MSDSSATTGDRNGDGLINCLDPCPKNPRSDCQPGTGGTSGIGNEGGAGGEAGAGGEGGVVGYGGVAGESSAGPGEDPPGTKPPGNDPQGGIKPDDGNSEPPSVEGADATGGEGDSSGCGCRTAGGTGGSSAGVVLLIASAALVVGRRRLRAA